MDTPKKKEDTHTPPAEADMISLIEEAKKVFYKDTNVIGAGIGDRRKSGKTHHDEVALIIYVKEKRPKGEAKG